MKKYLILLFLIVQFNGATQTWHSIYVNQISDFKVDSYKNNLWTYTNTVLNVIENNGQILNFNIANQGTTSKLDMCFTPGHTYYSKYGSGYGLYLFDNYSTSQVLYDDNIYELKQDIDTVFIRYWNSYPTKFVLFNSNSPMGNISGKFISKNGDVYSSDFVKYWTGTTSTNLYGQNNYLGITANTYKFKNYSDTLFIGFDIGISVAYKGICYDTLTPNNTLNMPSGNILEIEFDKNDTLWCLFGDSNDDAFAIASLHGNNWTNILDANNSPIDFEHFVGFEFDTLGNLWVASHNELHTLLGPNSPTWLNTINSELKNIEVFPNPANGKIELNIDDNRYLALSKIELYSLHGNLQKSYSPSKEIELSDILSGVYILNLRFNDGNIYRQKIIKQ